MPTRSPVKRQTQARRQAPTRKQGKIDVLRSPALAKIPRLVHGFSTRQGGASKIYGGNALNLGYTADDSRSAVERNRRAFVAAVSGNEGSSSKVRLSDPKIARFQSPNVSRGQLETSETLKPAFSPLVTLRQIHSDIIHCVTDVPDVPLAGDGLISRTPGILLAVMVADCLPVILVDPKNGAVGVFHAGWRGTLARIVEKGIGEMRKHFGTRAADLRAAIGPGIRGCCYEVGQELKDKFESQFGYAAELFRETKERDEIHEKYPLLFLTARAPGHSELPKKIFLDLAEANRRQLISAGVPVRNISDLGLCTACNTDRFFSHRAEKGKTGRMMAAVGIKLCGTDISKASFRSPRALTSSARACPERLRRWPKESNGNLSQIVGVPCARDPSLRLKSASLRMTPIPEVSRYGALAPEVTP